MRAPALALSQLLAGPGRTGRGFPEASHGGLGGSAATTFRSSTAICCRFVCDGCGHQFDGAMGPALEPPLCLVCEALPEASRSPRMRVGLCPDDFDPPLPIGTPPGYTMPMLHGLAMIVMATLLSGCASGPVGPVVAVIDMTPGARDAHGDLVSRCLRIAGSGCLAPAP